MLIVDACVALVVKMEIAIVEKESCNAQHIATLTTNVKIKWQKQTLIKEEKKVLVITVFL